MLTTEQQDALVVMARRHDEAKKQYGFKSTLAPDKARLLAEVNAMTLTLADALGGSLDSDTRQALALAIQANDALRQAAARHADELRNEA